ncbi:type II secretion system F family protein [Jatrophihabitans sp.]|uniref:type II secretion system F family protein n=1 Tax=Jatrophihabitans sp. TaxID=1932789 RepID=UPI002C80100B|nr:type II secretion system F family protein [Jatrophihabitans sp.]
MTSWWLGAVLGLTAALGAVLAIRSAPPMRALRIGDRIAPYLADTPAPSRLLAHSAGPAAPLEVVRRLLGPAAAGLVSWLDRLVGGSASVRRRLGGLGSAVDIEEFRIEQVVWGGVGMIGAACSLTGLTYLRGGVDPVLVMGAAGLGAAGGVLGRDWWLTRQVQRRERAMLAEFPVIADLLALAVLAGEAPVDAMQRVCRLTRGELTRDLQGALDEAKAGKPMAKALGELAERTTLEPFSRFLQGLLVAIERGTPLAEVLRAQATDVREFSKRALLEAGGRKELQMMVPVVFLILPVTVLFALYPGLLTLVSLSK